MPNLYTIYLFLSFLKSTLRYNIKFSIFFSQVLFDFYKLGVKSFNLISCLSLAVGFVASLQLISTLNGMLIPDVIIPKGIKNMIFLEFSPTIMCFIYIGRNITAVTSQLYDMKRNGYFDNLKVIGVNTTSYACLSKIFASTICYPLLTIFSYFFSLLGGYIYCVFFYGMTSEVFITSCVSFLNRGIILFSLTKSIVFGFLCGSIATFIGFFYYKETNHDLITINHKCFTVCCITVLIFDIIIGAIRNIVGI